MVTLGVAPKAPATVTPVFSTIGTSVEEAGADEAADELADPVDDAPLDGALDEVADEDPPEDEQAVAVSVATVSKTISAAQRRRADESTAILSMSSIAGRPF